MNNLFKENEILQKLNGAASIPNIEKFLSHDTKYQIDLVNTAKIKNMGLIFMSLVGLEGIGVPQKVFEERMRGYLNRRGVVGYNLIKEILLNQELDDEVFMYFISSNIKRISHFNKYIIRNRSLDTEMLVRVYDKIKTHERAENRMKSFKKVNFREEKELKTVLRGQTIGEFFGSLDDEEKELFISYVSLNQKLREPCAIKVLEAMDEDDNWFKLFLFKLGVNESQVMTEGFVKYLIENKNINNLEPIYKYIPKELKSPELISRISSPKRLAHMVGEFDRRSFEAVDVHLMFRELEDVLRFLREVKEIEQPVLIEMINLIKEKFEEGDYIEPEVVFGRGITDVGVLNALYSLNVDRVNRYLISCSATPDDLLMKLLQRGYDEEKIICNMKDRQVAAAMKKVFLR